jgi:hypothetical protein
MVSLGLGGRSSLEIICKLLWFGQCSGLADPSVYAPVYFDSVESVVRADPKFLSGAREVGIELSGCRHDVLMPIFHRPRPPNPQREGWPKVVNRSLTGWSQRKV